MRVRITALAAALLVGAVWHRHGPRPAHVAIAVAMPAPTTAPAADWRKLDLKAFRGYSSEALPAGWKESGDVISKSGSVGDLMTKDQFGNFDLQFDFKMGKGSNSGVFYHATTEYDHIYWSAPEYQLLDDEFAPDGKSRLTAAAADYALYPSPAGVVKPHDQWNAGRIVVNGAHVEHWLNGKKVVEYELWSPDWKKKVAASKFAAYPKYGMAKRGYIGFQGDHEGALALRNIRIRELP